MPEIRHFSLFDFIFLIYYYWIRKSHKKAKKILRRNIIFFSNDNVLSSFIIIKNSVSFSSLIDLIWKNWKSLPILIVSICSKIIWQWADDKSYKRCYHCHYHFWSQSLFFFSIFISTSLLLSSSSLILSHLTLAHFILYSIPTLSYLISSYYTISHRILLYSI